MPSRKKGGLPAVTSIRTEIDGTGRRFGSHDVVPLTVYHVPDLRPGVPGPWEGEADKIAWTDPATGMACIIRRSVHGHLGGYVAVEAEHPFYGYEADALPRDFGLNIHGMVSYAQACEHRRPVARSIWRKPPTPDAPPAWWFGFECNHNFDDTPARARSTAGSAGRASTGIGADGTSPSCFNRGCYCPGQDQYLTPQSIPIVTVDDAIRAGGLRTPVYRDEAYVYRECVHLAAQLDAVAKGLPIPVGPSIPRIGDDR